MESNWRWNVWELGGSTMGWQLVARLLHPIPPYEYVARTLFDPPYFVRMLFDSSAISGGDPNGPWAQGPVPFLLEGAFPGQYEVEPD